MGVFTWFVNARVNFELNIISAHISNCCLIKMSFVIKFVIFAKLQIKPRENSLLFNVYFKCVHPLFFKFETFSKKTRRFIPNFENTLPLIDE